MNITVKNRQKYKKYSELLWNFVYAANQLNEKDKKELSVYPLIHKCFEESHHINDVINPWNFDWENVDIESLVHVGDYFCKVNYDMNSMFHKTTYTLIHVIDIKDDATPQNKPAKSIYYQTIHLSKNGITITGKDIANVEYHDHDEHMYLPPFAAYIFDGVYRKIDNNVWDGIMNLANSTTDAYNKMNEVWK